MPPVLANLVPYVALAIFLATTLLAIMLGCILSYHWFRFAMNKSMALISLVIYCGGTFFLLSGLFAATLSVGGI